MKTIFILSFFFMSQNGWSFDYTRPALNSMTETSSSINQFTQPTDSEGKQEKQWNQEEEDLNYTDEEKQQAQEDKEINLKKEDEEIEDYRFDVPKKRD